MDSSQSSQKELLMFRSPMDAQNQIYIFNSPIDYKDQQLIVYQRPGMLSGENGYCVVYKRDHFIINSPPNYQSPTKRSFLNECIRQLYLMYGLGHKLHWEPNTSLASREKIWQQVDVCLQPERVTLKRASVERVKRQLFREDRLSRKNRKPARGNTWGTQVLNFKPMRHKIGRSHGYIRRDYFRCARHNVLQQLIYEKLKREVICSPAVCQSVIGAADGIFSVNSGVISDICRYHHNGARHQPAVERHLTVGEVNLRNNEACRITERAKRLEAMFIHEQVRRAVQNHQLILEESVRSVFYAKELFRLIEDHEEFVYTDKQILTRS
ncbi:uncharacterized protein Dwil_GK21056 [Drosophila willistoni]|uniref:Uncharacterized protein n=1 Tax=Drosophila willistoni TaxID=7260 RepID=B4N7B4_DROWI|nr:uncharacterized protein LOC6646558 [Drosophila willistoni]EDW80255.1 uncharacterized protein Dwil_GK21056 [Drosophila willistoni]